MKRVKFLTILLLAVALLVGLSNTTLAQDKKIRKSLAAEVSQSLGVDAKVTINYSRPGVKGRTIWGDLVPYGLNPGNKYSDNKDFPWRAGANENTTIDFSSDVKVNGKDLPAGKYSIHMIPSENDWVVIFNKVNDAWGSYKYDESQDALRINVTPIAAPHQEWLVYGFEDLDGTSATAFLQWEKLKVPFKIELK